MEITSGYKVELDPNNRQRTHLLQHAGAARFAWNWGLARRLQEYQETGKSSNAIEQHRQLNALKPTEFSWMYEVSKCAMQESLALRRFVGWKTTNVGPTLDHPHI